MEINYPYRKQTKLNTFKINLTKISKSSYKQVQGAGANEYRGHRIRPYGVNDRRKHLKTGIIV